MALASTIRNARIAMSHRRTERLAQRRLIAELASFSSDADRAELDEILDRHSAEETREIREILVRQDARRPLTAAGFRLN